MYDTSERVRRVKIRIRERQRMREKLLLGSLFSLCMLLSFSLVAVAAAIRSSGMGTVPGLYGAMLMFGDAGGYVVAGVIAFMAGVLVTVLCIRYRKKTEQQVKNSRKKMEG